MPASFPRLATTISTGANFVPPNIPRFTLRFNGVKNTSPAAQIPPPKRISPLLPFNLSYSPLFVSSLNALKLITSTALSTCNGRSFPSAPRDRCRTYRFKQLIRSIISPNLSGLPIKSCPFLPSACRLRYTKARGSDLLRKNRGRLRCNEYCTARSEQQAIR